MSAIADDYKSLQIVVDSVAQWAKTDGVQAFHREELVAELGALIETNTRKAMFSRPTHHTLQSLSIVRATPTSFGSGSHRRVSMH